MRKVALWAGLAIALGGAGAVQSRAQDAKPLEVIVFPGGQTWPIWAAQEQGFFARDGVEVRLTPTPGSVYQLTNLIEGKFDIAMTAIDNLIAYDEGQGEAPVSRKPDLIAVMGEDNGFLHLITVPEVKSFRDLKGRELSVDALTTGYAFVLMKLLQKGGLKPGDYTLVRAGGGLERFNALLDRKHAGTLLFTPFELIAAARGFNDLKAAIGVLGHYQGLVAGVRRDWAAAHANELIGYIRGFVAGLDWLYEPNNKAAAIAILRKNMPTMSPEIANQVHAVLLASKGGLARKGQLDLAGIKTVLRLRSEYGQPSRKLTDASKYYDLSYYRKATASGP